MFTNSISKLGLIGVVSSALLLSGCGGGGTASGGSTLNASYFPFSNASGNLIWTYRDTTVGSEVPIGRTVTYMGTAIFNGTSCHRLVINEDGAAVYDAYAAVSDGINIKGYQSASETNLYSGDLLILFSMTPGSSKDTVNTVTGAFSGTSTERLQRLADETITVPAGTFNCVVFQKTTIAKTGDIPWAVNDRQKVWYAPNVGMVKNEDYEDSSSAPVETGVLINFGNVL